MKLTAKGIAAQIQKGLFRPHTALTNMAISYFQPNGPTLAKSIFPICPVSASADNYYVFDKEDLLRDNWQRKPAYGKAMPAAVSGHTETYACQVDQMIMGIDQIRQTDLTRRQGVAITDPRVQRVKTIAAQANIHQDALFAKKFFKKGVWSQEYTGVDSTTITSGQFIKFSNGNSDPIQFIADQKTLMNEITGRTPNRLALGVHVFNALKRHPAILERVKFGGTTANPATVTENVLAQLFEVERIVVDKSIMNKAKPGQKAQMEYIGDPNAFLLAYATNTPNIEEPSAGYIFTWDMLGNGNYLPILNYLGENGTHSEYVEGLMATDPRKTADDLAMFFADAV